MSCSNPKKRSDVTIIDDQTGFRMALPESFSELDAKTKKEQFQAGKRKMDQLHDSTFVLSNVDKAHLYKHDDNNIFVLNIQNYNVENQGEYDEAIRDNRKFLFQTQQLNFPEARIDSSSSREMIDGVEFNKFILNTTISKDKTMHVINYNKLLKDKDFTASVIFSDEDRGKEILKAFKNAKFRK